MAIYFALIMSICMDFFIETFYFNDEPFVCKNRSVLYKSFEKIIKTRIISIFVILLVSSLRSPSVGLDIQNYLNHYNDIQTPIELFKNLKQSGFEFGYSLLVSLVKWLGLSFNSLLLIIAVFVTISFSYFINKISNDKLLSFVLYIALGIFAQSLNTLRQIIAMAIIVLGLCLLLKNVKKNWWKYIVITLIATLFHKSAIICLIFLPLIFIKPKWWIVFALFCLSIIGGLILPHIMFIVDEVLKISYFTHYFKSNLSLIEKSSIIDNLYSFSLILIFFALWIPSLKMFKLSREEKRIYDFFLMIYLFVPLIRIFGFIMSAQALFNRLSMYFFISLIVLIPLFLYGMNTKLKIKKLLILCTYVIAICYMYYLYAIKLSCGVVPYKFYF